jgi:hypothetical protein
MVRVFLRVIQQHSVGYRTGRPFSPLQGQIPQESIQIHAPEYRHSVFLLHGGQYLLQGQLGRQGL